MTVAKTIGLCLQFAQHFADMAGKFRVPCGLQYRESRPEKRAQHIWARSVGNDPLLSVSSLHRTEFGFPDRGDGRFGKEAQLRQDNGIRVH